MMSEFSVSHILPNGDCGVLIQFKPSEKSQQFIHTLAIDLMTVGQFKNTTVKIINVIPANDNMVLVFASPVNLCSALLQEISHCVDQVTLNDCSVNFHEIPVCYDQAVAKDFLKVCNQLNLTHQQLVDYHTRAIYRVDMLGFLPGFAYLSGNEPALCLPRKSTPEIQVEPGSVAIANHQTGIYSLQSPGGWHVIGRTPVALLDWQHQSQPMALNPSDQVKFIAIDINEFYRLSVANER